MTKYLKSNTVDVCEDMQCVILNETGYELTRHIEYDQIHTPTHIHLTFEDGHWILRHYDEVIRHGCDRF